MHLLKLDVEGAKTVMYAAAQPEYQPVYGTQVTNPLYGFNLHADHNTVLMAYDMTTEVELLRRGEPLLLHLLTFGRPLTPHLLTVGVVEAEHWYKVKIKR